MRLIITSKQITNILTNTIDTDSHGKLQKFHPIPQQGNLQEMHRFCRSWPNRPNQKTRQNFPILCNEQI